jgi:hypothetical protein
MPLPQLAVQTDPLRTAHRADDLPRCVFLHSSFRTGSTWLWTKFRRQPRVIAYYEIFNDSLSNLTPESLRVSSYRIWDSRHPACAPYFLEYLPLLGESGGVKGFEPAMAFARFLPLDGELSGAERDYLRLLLAQAQARERVPVLTCTRTLGRMPALASEFPGCHILLYRNLLHQWCSYVDQQHRNNHFFINTVQETIRLNQHDPFVRSLGQLFPLDDGPQLPVNQFYCFLFLHLYLYAHAAGSADIVVDLGQLETDPIYRESIEARVAASTDLSIDLSDCRNTLSFSPQLPGPRDELADLIQVMAGCILETQPSEEGRLFLDQACADFLTEYDRHQFYTRPIRKELERLSTELERCTTERDALAADRATQSAERDALVADQVAQSAERAALTVENATLRAERDAMAVLRVERDAMVALRAMQLAEQAALAAENAALRAERDVVRAERDVVRAECQSTIAGLVAENQRLARGIVPRAIGKLRRVVGKVLRRCGLRR